MTWLLGLGVAALAIGGLAAPWWLPAFAQRRTLRRRAANVAAYRTRLAELEADVAGGVVPREAAANLRDELAARLLQDVDAPAEPELAAASGRGLLAVVALALVAFTGIGYFAGGSWRTQGLIELARRDPEAARQASLNESIARLRERVEDQPDEFESWAWLARSYRTRGSYREAADAFAKANALRGNQDPDLLIEEGEAVAQLQERSMAGVPAERFAQALAIAPAHPQALWFAGIAAMQAGKDAEAIAHWEKLKAQDLPEDMRTVVEHSLARLYGRSGIAPPAPQAAAPQPAGLRLVIEVDIAPDLAAAVQPGDTLFVFAQDPAGPPMPLAVQRIPAALPARVALDDSMSPMPTRKLSSLERWRIVARISRSGNAVPQVGDLEGMVETGKADAATPIRVMIDRKRG